MGLKSVFEPRQSVFLCQFCMSILMLIYEFATFFLNIGLTPPPPFEQLKNCRIGPAFKLTFNLKTLKVSLFRNLKGKRNDIEISHRMQKTGVKDFLLIRKHRLSRKKTQLSLFIKPPQVHFLIGGSIVIVNLFVK